MPNRYIREDAIESESVNALTWRGEVFFRRLLNRADDFGRYPAEPKFLRPKIFPLQLDKVSEMDIESLLSECEAVGLLFVYVSLDGKRYLVLNKWEKGRAHKSKFPEPPKDVCERMKTFVYSRMQPQTFPPTPTPTPTNDSDTEKKERGGKDFAVAPPPGMPEDETRAGFIGERAGVPKERAVAYWNELASRGWRDSRGNQIFDFGRHAKIRYDYEVSGKAERAAAKPAQRGPSSIDISNAIRAKDSIADAIRKRHTSEVATGTVWNDPEKKKEYFKLKNEVKELTQRLANLA